MAPFDLLDYDDPDLLERLVGLEPKWNAYVELHNLIAAAEHPREFGPESRKRIGRSHGVDLGVVFEEERRTLYARYLGYCLADGALTGEERRRLAHLARTLALGVRDLDPIHAEAWGRTVSDALTDDCLGVEERLLLYTMQHTLGLDRGHTAAVYEEEARTRLLRQVAHALCDGELSSNEAAEIHALADEIGVGISADVQAMMDRAAYRWQIRHGDLPKIALPIPLLGQEVGHFTGTGTWFEMSYYRLRIERSGYRADLDRGETGHVAVPNQAIRRLGEGTICVTDRRLVLADKRRKPVVAKFSTLFGLTTVLGIPTVCGVERFQNGIRVALKGTRSLFVQTEELGLLYTVLARVLDEQQD